MRSLVVAQDFPWPVTIGSHLRLAQVIEVAASLGDTDVFALVPARRTEPVVLPPEMAGIRLKTVVRPPPSLSLGARLRWFSSSHLPLELAQEDPAALRREFAWWTASSYDFVWYSKVATFELLGRPRLGPTVVDLDDLEDHKILTRLAAAGRGSPPTGIGPRLRVAQAKRNARRWSRLQREVAAAVARVALCSELDITRSDLGNAALIPNGYDPPVPPLGRDQVGQAPSLLLVGNYLYPPNADAADFLVRRILPRITDRRPEVTVRLVGEANEAVARLHRPPAVTVVGRVEDLAPELARADLIVVPVRYGSGTRVKILEAAAHRIPVVSTTLGAEGLGFENDRHLLVADDPEAFASACLRLLDDPALRRRLVDEAEKEFLDRFPWSSVRARIRTLALEVAGVTSP